MDRTDSHLAGFLCRWPQLTPLAADIMSSYRALRQCIHTGGTIFTCGNGGSAADAAHIVGELTKSFVLPRRLSAAERALFPPPASAALVDSLQRGIRAQCLASNAAQLTAVANDVSADLIFAQPLFVLGLEGDVLFALSTSGNSRNVVWAAQTAKARGMVVVGLTGADAGELGAWADVIIAVPAEETHLAQELHLPIYHQLCLMLEEDMFGV